MVEEEKRRVYLKAFGSKTSEGAIVRLSRVRFKIR